MRIILTSHSKAKRKLLAIDLVIFNLGQVTTTTSELRALLLSTTSCHHEDFPSLDRFNVHRFLYTGSKLMTPQVRDHNP
ncbi:hypothetical protein TNCV_2613921 [Trichonephila clavipes]|nr:hypothetical protein TNCV_2613921 [Trichonephila clavipes]